MNIQKDKILHGLAGFVLALGFGYPFGATVGVLVAALAEVAKIVGYDMPRTPVMDWQEKGDDMLAQMVGAALGAALLQGLTLILLSH